MRGRPDPVRTSAPRFRVVEESLGVARGEPVQGLERLEGGEAHGAIPVPEEFPDPRGFGPPSCEREETCPSCPARGIGVGEPPGKCPLDPVARVHREERVQSAPRDPDLGVVETTRDRVRRARVSQGGEDFDGAHPEAHLGMFEKSREPARAFALRGVFEVRQGRVGDFVLRPLDEAPEDVLVEPDPVPGIASDLEGPRGPGSLPGPGHEGP
jgi:hypothetical protein